MKNPFTKRPKNEYGAYDEAYDNDFFRGDEDDDDGVIDDYETDAIAPPQRPKRPRLPRTLPTWLRL